MGGGVALAGALTAADQAYELSGDGVGMLLGPATPEGARAILGTIGGSVLSVAGIVFSITLAAIVFASAQYGPHVIPQYRRDKFSRAVLGTMLGVFAYCMAVLYFVQAGETVLVPGLALLGAMVLAGASLVMLVLFINHMLEMLHVSNVVARIGEKARRLLANDLPEEASAEDVQTPRVGHASPLLTTEDDPILASGGTGFVEAIHTEGLVAFARKHELRIDLLVRPGDYVTRLTPVARVAPSLPDDRSELLSSFAYGRRRTPDEDTAFLLDELCMIAFRALSPGVNDPFTAIDVIHQMTAVVERAALGLRLDAVHRDEDGTPRLRRPVLTFGDVLRLTLGRIAADAATNVTVAPVMVTAYESLLTNLPKGDRWNEIEASARRFERLCEARLPTEEAKRIVDRATDTALARGASRRGRGAVPLARLRGGDET